MTTTHLRAQATVLPHTLAADAVVEVANGTIRRVAQAGELDLAPGQDQTRDLDGILLPGLMDLQVNGAGGRSVDEATDDALDAVATAVRAGGATSFLPTLITAPLARLTEQLAAVARWIDSYDGAGARPLGIHLEGPFLETPGAHDPAHLQRPTPEAVATLLEAAAGKLRLMTLSPGLEGATPATRQLRAAGVAVALGHGKGPKGVSTCVEAGARLATHLFNVMGKSHHREPGMADVVLDQPDLLCSMILDGVHVHETIVRNAYRVLGPQRLVLTTDATAATGMPDGDYRLGEEKVTRKDGGVRNANGDLAGSCLTMAEAARNFLAMVPTASAFSLAQAAASNPASVIDESRRGRICPDNVAEFCLLRNDGTVVALPRDPRLADS